MLKVSFKFNIYFISVFGPSEFALTWVEVMMFRAFLLVERVTSINSETFFNPRWVNPVGPKTLYV